MASLLLRVLVDFVKILDMLPDRIESKLNRPEDIRVYRCAACVTVQMYVEFN